MDLAPARRRLRLATHRPVRTPLIRTPEVKRAWRGNGGSRPGRSPGVGEITLRDGNPASRGDLDRTRLNTEIDAGDKRGAELAGLHPEAEAAMAAIRDNLAAADEWAEKEARDWAEIEQAGVDEPVVQAGAQAQAT